MNSSVNDNKLRAILLPEKIENPSMEKDLFKLLDIVFDPKNDNDFRFLKGFLLINFDDRNELLNNFLLNNKIPSTDIDSNVNYKFISSIKF